MCAFAYAAVAVVSVFLHGWEGNPTPAGSGPPLLPIPLWQPELYLWTSGLTTVFVLAMSLWKM
jgi:hypothetical protein